MSWSWAKWVYQWIGCVDLYSKCNGGFYRVELILLAQSVGRDFSKFHKISGISVKANFVFVSWQLAMKWRFNRLQSIAMIVTRFCGSVSLFYASLPFSIWIMSRKANVKFRWWHASVFCVFVKSVWCVSNSSLRSAGNCREITTLLYVKLWLLKVLACATATAWLIVSADKLSHALWKNSGYVFPSMYTLARLTVCRLRRISHTFHSLCIPFFSLPF